MSHCGEEIATAIFPYPLPSSFSSSCSSSSSCSCSSSSSSSITSTSCSPLALLSAFYQWVPFCLSIQAMLFYLPHLIWQALAINSLGDNLECLLTRDKKANQVDDRDARQKLVNACANHLSQLSRQHADNRNNTWSALQHHLSRIPGGRLFIVGKRMGNRIAFLYLLVKLLYIANAFGQLFMIMKFLGHRDLNMATFAQDLFNILKSIREWGGSEFFPRQSFVL
nr:unnamed protein product [Spirometra erinaceieuropaei]